MKGRVKGWISKEKGMAKAFRMLVTWLSVSRNVSPSSLEVLRPTRARCGFFKDQGYRK